MSRLILLAVLSYLDSSGDEVFCEAVVVCTQTTCEAHPIESCPGSYDPKHDELTGKWNMGQCLTSGLLINKQDVAVLGCSPDKFSLDVDRDAVLRAKSKP